MIKVPTALLAQNINAYSDQGQLAKANFHKAAKAFLKGIAKELGSAVEGYTIRSNLGGMAVSGEVTLHSDSMYIQLSEPATSRGVSVLYRSCSSQKDYCGNRNNVASIREFVDEDSQRGVLAGIRRLIAEEVNRKKSHAVAH